MTTDICSIWAYHDMLDSGYISRREAEVLNAFSNISYMKPLTGLEVTQIIGREILSSETTRSRISALTRKGFLKKHDIVLCPQTHRHVNRWIYTGRKKPFDRVKECITCPRCKGAGTVEVNAYKSV